MRVGLGGDAGGFALGSACETLGCLFRTLKWRTAGAVGNNAFGRVGDCLPHASQAARPHPLGVLLVSTCLNAPPFLSSLPFLVSLSLGWRYLLGGRCSLLRCELRSAVTSQESMSHFLHAESGLSAWTHIFYEVS